MALCNWTHDLGVLRACLWRAEGVLATRRLCGGWTQAAPTTQATDHCWRRRVHHRRCSGRGRPAAQSGHDTSRIAMIPSAAAARIRTRAEGLGGCQSEIKLVGPRAPPAAHIRVCCQGIRVPPLICVVAPCKPAAWPSACAPARRRAAGPPSAWLRAPLAAWWLQCVPRRPLPPLLPRRRPRLPGQSPPSILTRPAPSLAAAPVAC